MLKRSVRTESAAVLALAGKSVVVLLSLAALLSCQLHPSTEIAFSFGRFPYDTTDRILIQVLSFAGEELIDDYEVPDIRRDGSCAKTLSISDRADLLVVYLWGGYEGDYRYFSNPGCFAVIDRSWVTTSCAVNYWLDYLEYDWGEHLVYELSLANVETIGAEFATTIEFSTQPYYLFKYSNAGATTLTLGADDVTGSITYRCSSDLDYLRSTIGNADYGTIRQTESVAIDVGARSTVYVLFELPDYGVEARAAISLSFH